MDEPGEWVSLLRTFRNRPEDHWWALEAQCGPYSPEKSRRLVIVTTDPVRLPERTTWYLTTNLPAPNSKRAQESVLPTATLEEVVRLYGLRIWVEQSYKQVKGALGWAHYQVRSDLAIRRHWQLVCCAFSFCWWALCRDEAMTVHLSVDTPERPAQVQATKTGQHLPQQTGPPRKKTVIR